MNDEHRDDPAGAIAEEEARRDWSSVTLENLSPLEVQVRALREDLAAYRWAIERILRRRLWAMGVVVAVVIVAVVTVGIGAAALLSHEAERSRVTLDAARLEACTTARTVQAQVAGILASLEERDPNPSPWLEDAIARVSVDPCPTRDP